MCYSAQVQADYSRYARVIGFDKALNIHDFVKKYYQRQKGASVKIPKVVDRWFLNGVIPDIPDLSALIVEYNDQQTGKLETEIFAQRKRLADAERKLAEKSKKAAAENKRIARNKVKQSLGRLSDIKLEELKDKDARIFPGTYAPVIVSENGERVIKLMRYQCRPAGKPALYDRKFPGTYNARRENLEGFWKDLFGYCHGIMIVNAFYENVSRHTMEHRELAPGEEEENVVLEFRPRPRQDMLVACLWSSWSEGGETLDSFSAITDEPNEEIRNAGHDRCIVPIKEEHIDAWLSPDPKNLAAQYAILDDRARPYYEHQLAVAA
jgi:putative SOS response-associated peptidase YedK